MAQTFDIVVACDSKRGIARSGQLPWRLPGDLKRFRELTVGEGESAVIMGRKTWDSLPAKFRPLPSRLNIVLSGQGALSLPDGVLCVGSLDEAVAAAEERGGRTCFVIGGGQVYAEALADPRCRRVYLTEVDGDFACDTFLAPLPDRFREKEVSPDMHDGDVGYRFKTFEAAY